MAVNPYFGFNLVESEQNLLDSLTQEAIQIHGIDVMYIVRDRDVEDRFLGEARIATFRRAYEIEMYIRTIDNFEGEGDLMSKFGFQVRDAMTLTVSNARFEQQIGLDVEGFSRPREGDLIYFPLNKKLWEIRHVEHESNFYALGKLYSCDLRCELFEPSQETFATGIPEIDRRAKTFDRSGTTLETIEQVDPQATNKTVHDEALNLIDYRETNIFGDDVY